MDVIKNSVSFIFSSNKDILLSNKDQSKAALLTKSFRKNKNKEC